MINFEYDFKNDGICIIKNAIDLEKISKANDFIDQFRKKNDSLLSKHNLLVDGMLQRVVNLHFSIKILQDIFCDAMHKGSKIVDSFGEATLYTSLFFELGSQQSLHRDTPYFFSGKDNGYMGVWVALDDTDETNRALTAVKGSHKLNEPDLDRLKNIFHPNEEVPPSSPKLFDAYNQELIQIAKKKGLHSSNLTLRKRDMVIWNTSTLHGGLAHTDKTRTRRSFVMHITPKNMPMKHMDYFFHREKKIPKVKKTYKKLGVEEKKDSFLLEMK